MSDIVDADTAAAETVSKPRSSWRDHLPVHPAAELFPLMSELELRALGEDIKKNGLLSPIIIDDEKLVDGRNRLDAIALLGMEFEFIRAKRGPDKGKIVGIESYDFSTPLSGAVRPLFEFWANPYDFVIGTNLHRRHLTSEQKRELIVKVLKAKPEASNATVAKQVKADDKTVAKVRRKLESTSEIPKLEKTVGADGKQRKKPTKKQEERDRKTCIALYQKVLDAEKEAAAEQRAAGSAETRIEQRKAEMARLAESNDDDTVDRALALVAAMDDQQRRRFHDKYMQLYGAATYAEARE
jgi:hypothetical protein